MRCFDSLCQVVTQGPIRCRQAVSKRVQVAEQLNVNCKVLIGPGIKKPLACGITQVFSGELVLCGIREGGPGKGQPSLGQGFVAGEALDQAGEEVDEVGGVEHESDENRAMARSAASDCRVVGRAIAPDPSVLDPECRGPGFGRLSAASLRM